MFIWREVYNYHYAISDGCLIIRSWYKNLSPTMRFPIGAGNKAAAFANMLEYCETNGETLRLYSLTQDMLEELELIAPGRYTAQETRDYFDYVYDVREMIELKGRKYHGKRNHLNTFKKNYDYVYSRIKERDADSILEVYDSWMTDRENDGNFFWQKERDSIEIMLKNIQHFGFTGGKVEADGKLCGFSIGERLNDDTVVIHIEKADVSVKGAYPAINQLFLLNEWSDYRYVNREDDSGVPGLRTAKLSYHPAMFIKKYECKPIKSI